MSEEAKQQLTDEEHLKTQFQHYLSRGARQDQALVRMFETPANTAAMCRLIRRMVVAIVGGDFDRIDLTPDDSLVLEVSGDDAKAVASAAAERKIDFLEQQAPLDIWQDETRLRSLAKSLAQAAPLVANVSSGTTPCKFNIHLTKLDKNTFSTSWRIVIQR